MDINRGKNNGGGCLEEWDDVAGVWWDYLNVEDKLWKACRELG